MSRLSNSDKKIAVLNTLKNPCVVKSSKNLNQINTKLSKLTIDLNELKDVCNDQEDSRVNHDNLTEEENKTTEYENYKIPISHSKLS